MNNPDRLRARQYLEKAKEAEERARATPYPDIKESWLKIASDFRDLARVYEGK